MTPGAGTAYIVLKPSFDTTSVTGAEFGATGWPDWVTSVTANPMATAVIGEPLSSAGCRILFPECMGRDPVVLFTVSFVAPESPPSDIPLQVVAVPGQSCPRVIRCDAPFFTSVCAQGASSWLSPSDWQAPELLSPADGAADQPISGVRLHWTWSIPPQRACEATTFDPIVYLGTDSNPPGPDSPEGSRFWVPRDRTQSGHATGPLRPDTTYYWKISIDGGGVSSPVWSFHTEKGLGIEPMRWQHVKELYR